MSWASNKYTIYMYNELTNLKTFCFSANEKRAFLLYYSIPLLTERLNETCLLHLAFLVGAVYRLLKDSISKIDLEEAGVFLKLYCAQAPYFFMVSTVDLTFC